MKVYDPRIDHNLDNEPGTHSTDENHASHVENNNPALVVAHFAIKAGQKYGAHEWAFVMDCANYCDAPVPQPMTEQRARELLNPQMRAMRFEGEKGFQFERADYATWYVGDEDACLDGTFSADQLEAIAWWMRNKQ